MKKNLMYWALGNILVWIVAIIKRDDFIELNIDIWYLLFDYITIAAFLSILSTIILLLINWYSKQLDNK